MILCASNINVNSTPGATSIYEAYLDGKLVWMVICTGDGGGDKGQLNDVARFMRPREVAAGSSRL